MATAPAADLGLLTPERLLGLLRPGEVNISADGKRVAFTVSPIARDKGKSLEARLWVDGAPATEPGAADAAPRLSRDGAALAYASDRGHAGRMSLWIHGRGELGSIRGSVEDISWSPDATQLLVLAADLGSDRAGAQTATKIAEAGAGEEDPKVMRPAQHWRRLYLVDAESGDTRVVSPEGVNVFEFDWAGDEAVAVCTDTPTESAWYDAWIGLLDLGAQTAKRIHTPEWQVQSPRISSGGRLAWIEGFASDRAVLTGTVNVHGKGPLAPELDVTFINWLDEDTISYAGSRRSASHFGRLHTDGAYEELYAGDAIVGHRFQQQIAVGGDRIVGVYETPQSPPEVVEFVDGVPHAFTSLNGELAASGSVAEWRELTWESFDGLEIQGLLCLPRERSADQAVPIVVWVHGGPTGTWSWQYPVPSVYLLAQAGYATFFPNPRGSSGRGQEFALANLGDMGGGDLKDILTGIDSLVASGVADDARIAITGGSYGGFMSTWAVTQTDRFAAAIPMAVVTDWTSFHYTTNIGHFDALFLQGEPDDPNGPYPQWSPVFHARNATTPTLIMHGEEDLCTPLPQATEFYNALVENGCEVELVIYPREGHGWTERDHQIDAWERMRDWLAKHL
jgi:dipeptidyl aminopeptidase/acylaminoacyl peptidase